MFLENVFSYLYRNLRQRLRFVADPGYRQVYQTRKQKAREIDRLSRLPRYVPASSDLLGPRVRLLDSSFLDNYREIFEKEIYKFQTDNLEPYILDCGANVGLSIIYFKRLYPKAVVIGFEPDPNIFAALSENIRSFDLKNVTLVPKAVWSEETRLRFYPEGGNSSRIATSEDDKNIIEVQTTSLRPFINRRVDFLKIDIEGAEAEVMDSCKDLLHLVDSIFIEYHSFEKKPQRLNDILTFLSNAGFRYYLQHTGITSSTPLCQISKLIGMDLQLNIFGYRVGQSQETLLKASIPRRSSSECS